MTRQTFAKWLILLFPLLLLLVFSLAEKFGVRLISIFTK